ncbi:MAG: peroxidase-related enzyme [Pseudomonadota bacterium]
MAYVSSIPADSESVWAIMSRYMDQTKPLFALTQQVMRAGEASFTDAERELLAAVTSLSNACNYCYGVHRSTAESFGVDAALLEAIAHDVDGAPVDDKLKPVIKYVQKLTASPSKVTQADADRIFDAGYSENDFHYVVMVCALFNFFNRLIDGYGVQNTPDYRANHGKELADHGYQL